MTISMRRSIVFYSVCFVLLGVLRGWSQIISPDSSPSARLISQTGDAKPLADAKRESDALAWTPPASGMDTLDEVSPAQRKFGGDAEHYAQTLAELLEMTSLGFRDPSIRVEGKIEAEVRSPSALPAQAAVTPRVDERRPASTAHVSVALEVDLSQENAVRDPAQGPVSSQALEIEPLAESAQSNL